MVSEEEVLRFCEQRRKDLVTGDRNVEGVDVVRMLATYILASQKDIR